MCQSSSLSVEWIRIPVMSSIKFDENIHILVCKLAILLDSQVSGLGPQIKWFLENLSLFSMWKVICKGLDSVRKILSQMKQLCFSLTLTWKQGRNEIHGIRDQRPEKGRAVSRKSRKLFGPEKPFAELPTACFGEPIFQHVFKVTKRKMTVKCDDLSPLRSWITKGIVTPENGP